MWAEFIVELSGPSAATSASPAGRVAARAWMARILYVAPNMEGDTPHADATNPRASFRNLNKRRKWLMTALTSTALLAWPLGLLDWRTWQHGYREWQVSLQIRVGTPLKDVLSFMPSPTRTAGHAGTQYLEFENGGIVVLLDFGERVSQVVVKRPAGPGTPTWLIVAAITILAAYTGHLWWRDRLPAAGHCPACAYDLRGNISGRCPECGTLVGEPPGRGSERLQP